MDYFSRRPEVAFTFKVDTSTVKHFLAMVFRREGNPKEFLWKRDVRHYRSAVYNPGANGVVEKFNRVLKDCLQTASIQADPWKFFTQTILMDYRSTPQATTGVTPSELLHGQCMRSKLQTFQ